MESIKRIFDRYGASEWATLVIGIIIAIMQGIRYTTYSLGETTINWWWP